MSLIHSTMGGVLSEFNLSNFRKNEGRSGFLRSAISNHIIQNFIRIDYLQILTVMFGVVFASPTVFVFL